MSYNYYVSILIYSMLVVEWHLTSALSEILNKFILSSKYVIYITIVYNIYDGNKKNGFECGSTSHTYIFLELPTGLGHTPVLL